MKHTTSNPCQYTDIIALFQQTFTDSEGIDGGKTIGQLASDILAQASDMHVCITMERDTIVAAIILSKLEVNSSHTVYLLSPVAVQTDKQGKGIGQNLIRFGFETVKALGADVVVTYGDPNFYGKLGFEAITEAQIKAPQPLSFPHGWIATHLAGGSLDLGITQSHCIAALNDPKYW